MMDAEPTTEFTTDAEPIAELDTEPASAASLSFSHSRSRSSASGSSTTGGKAGENNGVPVRSDFIDDAVAATTAMDRDWMDPTTVPKAVRWP